MAGGEGEGIDGSIGMNVCRRKDDEVGGFCLGNFGKVRDLWNGTGHPGVGCPVLYKIFLIFVERLPIRICDTNDCKTYLLK